MKKITFVARILFVGLLILLVMGCNASRKSGEGKQENNANQSVIIQEDTAEDTFFSLDGGSWYAEANGQTVSIKFTGSTWETDGWEFENSRGVYTVVGNTAEMKTTHDFIDGKWYQRDEGVVDEYTYSKAVQVNMSQINYSGLVYTRAF